MDEPSPGDAVTLIVVAYNHERFLPALLESIDAQVRPPDRVILCDDRSSDRSRSLLGEWAARTSIPVDLRFNDTNQGLTRTLNAALELVATPLYAYISGDDVLEPTRTRTQARTLGLTDHSFVYSDASVIDEDGTEVSASFVALFLGPDVRPTDTFEALLTHGNWIPACSVMLRTEAVRAVGGYDEDLFFEDYDLWLRLSRRGTFTRVPSREVRFRRVGDSLGSTRFDDADDGWQWAKVRIRAKHLGVGRDVDRVVVGMLRPWLITLAARGHPRADIAPILRTSFVRAPGAAALAWAVAATLPVPGLLQRLARQRRK
jgi:glycosyltransferase involved in cell wall biosynthesis